MLFIKLRPHLSKNNRLPFRFLRLSRKRLTIDATTHIFLERSRWVVAVIVYRLRDNRQNTNTEGSTLVVSTIQCVL